MELLPTSSEFLTARYLHSTVKYSDSSVESGTGYDYLAQASAQTFFEIVLYPRQRGGSPDRRIRYRVS